MFTGRFSWLYYIATCGRGGCVQKANCMACFVAVRITGLQYAAVSVAKSAVDVKIRCLSQLLLLHIICNQYDCVHNFASLGF